MAQNKEKKQFSLVYEDNGVLKGSYSGIPSKNDTALIERAILEGTKPAPQPVPGPSGTISITENGTDIDVAAFAKADVAVPNPSVGTLDIVSNGEYDVTEKAGVKVNVPNPSTGNKDITTTGQVDVKDFATAQVKETNLAAGNIKKDVSILGITGTYEGYPEPSGSYYVTENG